MSDEKIVVDDLTILGNACPDEISGQRIGVCVAGYSPTRGLIRIYPVPPNVKVGRWDTIEVPLERNPKDVRPESWKIQGSKNEWDRLHRKIIKGKLQERADRMEFVEMMRLRHGVGCIEDLNEAKVSLGMIKPKVIKWELVDREELDETHQLTLTSAEALWTKKNYPLKPMVTYRCQNCRTTGPHHQQIVEWGLYEFMRNNKGNEDRVWKNLHLGEPGYDFDFLVGNMALHPTSFMVISVFRFKAPLR